MLLKAFACVVRVFRVMYVPVSVPPNVPLEALQPEFRVFRVYCIIIQVHFEMPLNLSAGRLRKEDCATSIQYGLRPGESKLDELNTDGIWDYMMRPIVDAQEAVLRARERDDLIPLEPRYNTFVLLLGMVRPMQVDGVRDRDGLVYNAYLARLLSRGQYYDLHKHCRPDVVGLIEAVGAHWAAAWTMGGAATGDETLVPHTGLRAGPLKMYLRLTGG